MRLSDVAEHRLPLALPPDPTPAQVLWHYGGFHIAQDLIPADLRDAYIADYLANGPYGVGTAYLDSEPMRDLLLHPPLMSLLGEFVGEPVALHLVLTGWTSTERDWHADAYLNPTGLDAYAAVWIPLEPVMPDAGPFQCVPGSHRWPTVTRAGMLAALGEDGSDPDWPRTAERILTPMVQDEITERGAQVYTYLGQPGEALVWSSRLYHRGSRPKVPGTSRRALIAHYSGARPDMPNRAQHGPDPSSQFVVF